MKGSNAIELNQATMVEVVQYWLESQFAEGKAPIVDCVKYEKNSYTDTFRVETRDPDIG